MDLGNGRKEMQKKPIENRNTPLVIPKALEAKRFKVYDETKEIFRLSKEIFEK